MDSPFSVSPGSPEATEFLTEPPLRGWTARQIRAKLWHRIDFMTLDVQRCRSAEVKNHFQAAKRCIIEADARSSATGEPESGYVIEALRKGHMHLMIARNVLYGNRFKFQQDAQELGEEAAGVHAVNYYLMHDKDGFFILNCRAAQAAARARKIHLIEAPLRFLPPVPEPIPFEDELPADIRAMVYPMGRPA